MDRKSLESDSDRQLVTQFLSEIGGASVDRETPVFVIGATNMELETLDPALTRSGRLERWIHVPMPDFTYGAHAAEVAVDIETGEVSVLQSIGAHDVGQAVNLRAVEGQIEGSALMGQGFALSEELILDKGRLTNDSLSEYLIPTSEDVPEIKAIVLESRSGLGPFGSKGIGEPVFAPVAASIANAVADAIGIRIFDLPITPEKVIKALREKEASG